MTTIAIPLAPAVFWPIFALACLLGSVWLIYRDRPAIKTPWLDDVRARFGLQGLDGGLFAVALLLYGGVFLSLTGGLFWLIWHVIAAPFQPLQADRDLLRFDVVRIAALTATLGAVIALPFTLLRLRLTQKATETASETLFNQKIDAAVQELHAQRQVTNPVPDGNGGKRHQDFWKDDIVRRNAAIDRLEGLAGEYKDEYGAAKRIARLLSVYLRELSREYPAKEPPEEATPEELRRWAQNLEPARSDMQTAAQSLGRIRHWLQDEDVLPAISLAGCNLQGLHLSKLSFRGADLSGAKLQGADLAGAKLQGANLSAANFDDVTRITTATLRGAMVILVDFTNVPQIADHVSDIFGDGSVTLPEGCARPDHWPEETLNFQDFRTQWRAWQRSIGQDPDNPE